MSDEDDTENQWIAEHDEAARQAAASDAEVARLRAEEARLVEEIRRRTLYARGEIQRLNARVTDLEGQLARALVLPPDRSQAWMALWTAMNRHPKVCGVVSEERLDDCAWAALEQVESWRVDAQPAEPPHRNGCTGRDHDEAAYPACWTDEQVAQHQADNAVRKPAPSVPETLAPSDCPCRD